MFRGFVVQSTVEQNCICGDHTLQVYTYCTDHAFQAAHLHMHPMQRMRLAVTLPEHAMLLCGSLVVSLLYHNHLPVQPCTH